MNTKPTETNAPVQPLVMLPCPFCGSPPHGAFGSDANGMWRVECFGNNYACGDWTIEAGNRDEAITRWNGRDWRGMSKQFAAVGFLQGVLQGLRIGIDEDRAKIIDSALSDERYFAT